ncbi:MAG: hypothetical protein HYS05_20070 [Acidobacteria bacterium]|nr:hypothetical protein [Acidobacteriota bacterium]
MRRGVVALHRDAPAPERVGDAASQAADLVCYLMNLADDLQKWLTGGTIAPDVLPQVSRRGDQERTFDEEIPF